MSDLADFKRVEYEPLLANRDSLLAELDDRTLWISLITELFRGRQ